jgi:hypothetical protein
VYNSANSESGTIFIVTTSNAANATYGAGTTGTRLKATFTNLPANVQYYVSATNVVDYQTGITAPAAVGDNSLIPYAVAVGNGAAAETAAYPLPAVPVCGGATICANGVVPIIALTRNATTGAAEFVWEVTNGNPAAADTYSFALFAQYALATPPAPGNTATVQLGYAPQNGALAPGVTTTALPRFAAPAMTAATFFNVVTCQTSLLFPYVTNGGGYETGIAISNTSMDPFGTIQGSGACSMYFYGPNQPSNAIAFANPAGGTTIAAGGQIANTLSNILGQTGFSGYAVAVCNFQFAHGFAFIQTAKQTLGMGYMPLVMQTGSGLNTRGSALVGESLNP